MTLLEFEAWVSDNYRELAKLAKQVTNRDDAIDLLHALIESICDGRSKLPPMPVEAMGVGVFARMLRNDKVNIQVMEKNQAEVKGRFADSFAALEDDIYTDTKALTKQRLHREEWVRKRDIKWAASGRATACKLEAEAAKGMLPGNLFYGASGDSRWRYQQRRDAKLYDGQVVRSLGEHIRGRSSRSLHGAGRSLVHWGAEGTSVRPWGKEVAGYMGSASWTFISSSTGTQYRKLRFGMGSPHAFQRCGGCSEHAISGRHDKACALKRSAA